jgi:hypothetical protein
MMLVIQCWIELRCEEAEVDLIDTPDCHHELKLVNIPFVIQSNNQRGIHTSGYCGLVLRLLAPPHRLPIKVARIFKPYGTRMHPNDGRVVDFIIQTLLGRDITVYGEGQQTRSFLRG